MAFKEIKAEDLTWNPFQQIGKGWFLVTAGTKAKCNGMTVSWGGLGVWWGKNAATVYIRKNRFTKTFIDAGEQFTISAMPESCRKALGYMGSHSGWDGDKWEAAGLTPMDVEDTAAPEEAEVIIVCRKMLATELPETSFIEPGMKERWYAGKDEGNYHTMYIAEIEKVLVKD